MAIVISMDFGNRFFKLDMKIRVCHNFFSIPFALKNQFQSRTGTYDFEQYSRWSKLLRVMRL